MKYPYWLNILYWSIPIGWIFCIEIFLLAKYFILKCFYWLNSLYWNTPTGLIFCTEIIIFFFFRCTCLVNSGYWYANAGSFLPSFLPSSFPSFFLYNFLTKTFLTNWTFFTNRLLSTRLSLLNFSYQPTERSSKPFLSTKVSLLNISHQLNVSY